MDEATSKHSYKLSILELGALLELVIALYGRNIAFSKNTCYSTNAFSQF